MIKVKRKLKLKLLIFLLLNVIMGGLFLFSIIKINMIPIKYLILLIVVILLLIISNLYLINKKKVILNIFGYIIFTIFSLSTIVGSYYVLKTNNFLDGAFNNAKNTYVSNYYVISLKEGNYNNLNDLSMTTIGYYDSLPHIDMAINDLKDKIPFESKSYNDISLFINDLDNGVISAFLVEKSFYNFLGELDEFDNEKYSIIYQLDLEIEEEVSEVSTDGDSFNIYIGGTDFTEMYTDFNMIVTINKKTHKILLTSTPRDFYVELDGKGGAKDLLGYAGVWGINTSRKTLENLYDIDIDYYVKINTSSLVGLVDTLGGVEFCADQDFTTTHALVLGTYDDSKGQKLHVPKGCNEYNGIEILTIARERLAFVGGDRQRQKNCQQIMINIFNKLISTELIKNYAEILNAVSDLYTTNIPKELVTSLAKDTINKGIKWTFEQQSVNGSDSRGNVHLSNYIAYVMIPNEDSVRKASYAIKQAMK